MRKLVKHMVAVTYKPLLARYISSTRSYAYKGIRLQVPPQVFHPGFFFSTRLLLNYIQSLPLAEKKVLELGAGSGLLSMYTARQGAQVTATDINKIALHFLKQNKEANGLEITIIHSDLFQKIEEQTFDLVLINPPYYKKNPVSEIDYAWCCGEKGEYFQQLFKSLARYIHSTSDVLMTLCDGCDIEMVKSCASKHHFRMEVVYTKQNLLEKNFIYKIEPAA